MEIERDKGLSFGTKMCMVGMLSVAGATFLFSSLDKNFEPNAFSGGIILGCVLFYLISKII